MRAARRSGVLLGAGMLRRNRGLDKKCAPGTGAGERGAGLNRSGGFGLVSSRATLWVMVPVRGRGSTAHFGERPRWGDGIWCGSQETLDRRGRDGPTGCGVSRRCQWVHSVLSASVILRFRFEGAPRVRRACGWDLPPRVEGTVPGTFGLARHRPGDDQRGRLWRKGCSVPWAYTRSQASSGIQWASSPSHFTLQPMGLVRGVLTGLPATCSSRAFARSLTVILSISRGWSTPRPV